MNQWGFEGKQQSEATIVRILWEKYISDWSILNDAKFEGDWLQRLEILRESVRRTMRAEHAAYLRGAATRGRVSETKGHAILIGKMIAANQQAVR